MNGLAIIEKNETGTTGIIIDQDTIECARLNARIQKRIAQNEANERKAQLAQQKVAKAEARRKAFNRKTIKSLILHGGICGAVIWLGFAGMAHPVICIPVALYCLCAACVRLGAWLGRGDK